MNYFSEAELHKWLWEVLILEELPRNVAGKILKRELRENYIQQHA